MAVLWRFTDRLDNLPRSTNGLDLGDDCIDADLPTEAGPVNGGVTGQTDLLDHGLQFYPLNFS